MARLLAPQKPNDLSFVFTFVLGRLVVLARPSALLQIKFRSPFIERNLINCAIRRGASGWALSYLPSLFSFLLTQWECKGTTAEISGAGDAQSAFSAPFHRTSTRVSARSRCRDPRAAFQSYALAI